MLSNTCLDQILDSFPNERSPKDMYDFKVETNEDPMSEVKLNPVISLAMEQVRKDIETLSEILHISTSEFCFTSSLLVNQSIYMTQRAL
jgi:hypothetical protein